MIAPLVQEEEWIEALQYAPSWTPPSKPMVVIAPHPDDETLGAGGLIAARRRLGMHVSAICVTDGEAAYKNTPGLAAVRTIEQESALQTLGVRDCDIWRLKIPDSRVAEHESELAELLATLIEPGSLVLAPWIRDWHPDHEACGRAAQQATRELGVELAFYLFWTWHQATTDLLVGVTVRKFELDEQLLSLKQAALRRHHSQLYRLAGPPILPDNLLKPSRRPFETFIFHD